MRGALFLVAVAAFAASLEASGMPYEINTLERETQRLREKLSALDRRTTVDEVIDATGDRGIQDAVNSGPRVILLKPGTYKTPIEIHADDITLIGSGAATVLTNEHDPTEPPLKVTGRRVVIKRLSVRTQAGGGQSPPVIKLSGERARLEDITILEGDSDGIHVDRGVRIVNCRVEGVDRCGIVVTDGSRQTQITGTLIASCGVSALRIDEGAKSTLVDGCHIFGEIKNQSSSSRITGNVSVPQL